MINEPFSPRTEREAQTICYLTNWSHKRPGAGMFMPEDIDASLCTHVIYAFATLKKHLLSESNDKDAEMYEKLIALREKNPDVKVTVFLSKIIYFIFTTQEAHSKTPERALKHSR